MNSARTLLSVAAAVLVVGLAGFRNGEALARPSMEPEKSKAPIRKATIADAAFISGSWSVTTEKRFTQEVWTAAKAGRMTGMFRWIKADGSPLLYELLTIAEKGGGLEMRLAHFDADLSPLPGLKETIALVASELEPGRIVFCADRERKRAEADRLFGEHRVAARRGGVRGRGAIAFDLRASKGRKMIL